MSAMNIITIPSSYYEILFEKNFDLPQVEEIRKVGKGRQYDLDQDDPNFQILIQQANISLAPDNAGTKDYWAAVAMIRAMRRQGITIELAHPLPQQESSRSVKIKTRCTLGGHFGKYSRRDLIVEVDHNGTISIRPHGTRQVELISADAVYAMAVRSKSQRAALEKARAKKAARAAKKAERLVSRAV
jgi:hypothetical protein